MYYKDIIGKCNYNKDFVGYLIHFNTVQSGLYKPFCKSQLVGYQKHPDPFAPINCSTCINKLLTSGLDTYKVIFKGRTKFHTGIMVMGRPNGLEYFGEIFHTEAINVDNLQKIKDRSSNYITPSEFAKHFYKKHDTDKLRIDFASYQKFPKINLKLLWIKASARLMI